MNFSQFFISRPIFAAVLSLLILIAGAISLFQLPISEYPEVVPPTVVVRANFPGANPKVIGETVAAPLEQAITGVENMLYMSSQSTADGKITLTITFALGTDLDNAQVQVQNRVTRTEPKLPEEVTRIGITVDKASPDLTMVVHLTSPDKRYDMLYLSNYALLNIKDELARLGGVGDVQLFGMGDYSLRVWLDPNKTASRNLTATDVVTAIREQNRQVAAGALGAPPAPNATAFQLSVNTQGRLVSEEEFENIIIRSGDNGEITRLKDIARVELGSSQYALRSLLNNQPAVAIPIFQRPGSNAIEISNEVRSKMAELKKSFPEGMDFSIVYDPTIFVRGSIEAVVHTLFEALILVVLVVILFLQTWRASIIPLVAVPVSLIGTFAVMHLFGFSLNALSLFGLVLAIGIVVDDAIVVVENVERNIGLGLTPVEATKRAMREVTGPIIATALVLCAVFIPAAFISGLTGQFYKQFALTIAISTVISAFNSLTLSPALSAVFLRNQPPSRFPPFRLFNAAFTRSANGYAWSIRHLIGVRWIVMAFFALGLLMTWGIYSRIPTTFLPVEDQGYFFAVMQLPDGASVERTEEVAKQVRDILKATPGVADVVSVSGFNFLTGAAQSNTGVEFAVLKPWGERGADQSAQNIVNGVRGKLLSLPAGFALSFDPPSIPGISPTGGFEFQLEDLTGRTPEELSGVAQALLAEARKQKELDPHALFSSFSTSTPQYDYQLDRTKAKLLGLDLPDVFSTLQIFFGSLYVNDFNQFGRTFRVTMQAEQGSRAQAGDLSRLYVRNNEGRMLPLNTLGQLKPTVGPEFISHYNAYGSALINGGPAPGYSSSQAIAAMQRVAATVLPADYGYEWTGITYQELKAGDVAILVFGLAIVFVFLFLAAQYESFSMPFMVLLAVPLALFGAVLALWLRGMQIDVYSQVGFVMLIGLSAKNAILIVEFAKRRRLEGHTIVDSAMEAGRLRLRPILMTAFAFILGVVPLMIAHGAGAASRQSIGTTVFGGMLAATLLSLAFVPVFYALIERWREGRAGREEEHRPAAVPAAGE